MTCSSEKRSTCRGVESWDVHQTRLATKATRAETQWRAEQAHTSSSRPASVSASTMLRAICTTQTGMQLRMPQLAAEPPFQLLEMVVSNPSTGCRTKTWHRVRRFASADCRPAPTRPASGAATPSEG